MKVLVCGSRMFGLDSDGRAYIRDRLDTLPLNGLYLVVGGAPGPDEFAREWAVDKCVDHLVRYADWNKHGKRAGFLRNISMLDEKPDLVIAFWDGKSRGTAHTIAEARRRGIPVEVVTHSDGAQAVAPKEEGEDGGASGREGEAA